MKNLIKYILVLNITLLMLASLPAKAGSLITSDLCVSLENAVEIGVSVAPEFAVHAEGGAGWGMAFVGKIVGAVAGAGSVDLNAGNAVNLSVDYCVNAEDLITMYRADLLTPQQKDIVGLYLGQNAFKDDQAEEAQSGLLSAGFTNGLQVKRTEAILRPLSTTIELQTRIISGELSLLDMMDETIYAVESLADALPMEPTLAKYMGKFGDDLANKVANVQQGLERICKSITGDGSPLGAVCENVINLQKGGDKIHEGIQKVIAFGGTIAGQIKQLDKVIDSAGKVMGTVDSALGSTIGKLDGVTQTVGSTSRQVVAMASDTKRTIGGMTQAVDGAVSTTNKAIGGIQDVVITPLELATKASKSTIEAILTVLGNINSKLKTVTSAMEGEV